jgi:16S rRNA (guanine1207-N2)-methyltransferase
MPTRRTPVPLSQRPVPNAVLAKVRAPLCVALGSPAEVINVLSGCRVTEATCFQIDLHQAERLRSELSALAPGVNVVTAADLWDLPADFQTVLYLAPRGGERELKIDVADQAFHVLRPRGAFVVWSPYEGDLFFPNLLKKVFGKVKVTHADPDSVFWSQREGDRPRRRHELTFQAKVRGGDSCRFVSRPGTFSYGRFDDGARALVEVARIAPGERVVDLGCGCGTNGIFAAQRAGPDGFIAFVDSNLRALALADANARANGVRSFATYASATAVGPEEGTFDVVLANPPYYGAGAIAKLFIERGKAFLKADGRFYLVTRQPNEVAPQMVDAFGEIDALEHRGYTVLSAGTDGEYADSETDPVPPREDDETGAVE